MKPTIWIKWIIMVFCRRLCEFAHDRTAKCDKPYHYAAYNRSTDDRSHLLNGQIVFGQTQSSNTIVIPATNGQMHRGREREKLGGRQKEEIEWKTRASTANYWLLFHQLWWMEFHTRWKRTNLLIKCLLMYWHHYLAEPVAGTMDLEWQAGANGLAWED